ncbi:MAG: transketolase [Candidatus Pacebacteria bacterium]|jgi:transketolase|nr:transketolase [Candidatus Paceibacterota bacterium]
MPLSRAEIEVVAYELREEVIKMIAKAQSGHCAGPLGAAEIYATLFFSGILNYCPQKPNDPNRDRVVVSNGHYAPLLYATLAYAGYFPKEELSTLRKLNSRLQGHPHRLSLPGIETSSGPVGEGLSQAVGMALAAKMDNRKYQVYCLSGDGEQDCGNHWEAVMLAGKYQLDNLTLIIDRNNIQIDGFTEKVLPLEPLVNKYESFGWKTLEVDGHNVGELLNALKKSSSILIKPVAIIAHTVPGQGVDFMENDYQWHGKVPNSDQTQEALRQLAGKILNLKRFCQAKGDETTPTKKSKK